ncbi:holin, Cph1 family [Ligilactobacillus sp. WC1T17]|uniref:Holin, Cph1 family n=1 Tax=Ligilactobacillus ruminis TaxID=1623 RepID=A0ABY1AA04_9LACO|nr:holin, Cph1 family [Ligilactobacillus ruminis]
MLHIEYIKHLSALIDNPVFFAFFLAVLIDVMTGFVKSLVNKNTTSSKGLSGLIKHSTLLLIASVLYPFCDIYGASGMADMLLIFYILFYAISITENLGQMGIPIPTWLKKYIYKLSDDYRGDDDEK